MFFVDGYSAELLNNLSALIENNRVPHAVIIEGGNEQKRLELATSFANAMICTADQGNKPCGMCSVCKKVQCGSHPDVILIQAEDKKKTISVDVIRKMRDDAYVLPNEAERKIYIVNQAHTMQPYAQNALLKVLEEPPKYASFILLCDYHTELLQTVLSRCVVYNIESIESDDFTQQIGDKEKELSEKISVAVSEKNELELLVITSEFEKNSDLMQSCLVAFELILRDALIMASGGQECISASFESARILAGRIEKDRLIKLIESTRKIISQVEQHANNNLTITRLCTTLIQVVQN